MEHPQEWNDLERARREKLRRFREEAVDPYGRRVEGLVSLAEARALFDPAAHEDFVAARGKGLGAEDRRKRARVAGRCVQHRPMGGLVFIVVRDHTGDLQVTASREMLSEAAFGLVEDLDYGDIIVAEGPVGATRRGEICVWADRLELACKSLTPPPGKYHGLTDPELRYRHRYVDLYANPRTIRVFQARSRLVARCRSFMEARGYLEVETPMMQAQAGGAAARPFVTQHNALNMRLFLRIAPELYLKRVLVGGLPRVYELGRNFRNEGVDARHNPEFTQMEAYEAFGDCGTMMELVESLLRTLAAAAAAEGLAAEGADRAGRGGGPAGAQTAGEPVLPFGEHRIDYGRPFDRIAYEDLFARAVGCAMTDTSAVRGAARRIGLADEAHRDDWLVVNDVYERLAEPAIDPARPTFVMDYPAAISPLTRPRSDRPAIAERWELLIGGMEIGTGYTELNDPDLQRARFEEQLRGADEEQRTFRSLDEDFLEALRVGMPPAGGVGLGIDRIVMLMTDCRHIRDVILFPLLRPG
jgi:lysyl-tRNA synthetase class 2